MGTSATMRERSVAILILAQVSLLMMIITTNKQKNRRAWLGLLVLLLLLHKHTLLIVSLLSYSSWYTLLVINSHQLRREDFCKEEEKKNHLPASVVHLGETFPRDHCSVTVRSRTRHTIDTTNIQLTCISNDENFSHHHTTIVNSTIHDDLGYLTKKEKTKFVTDLFSK